MRTACVAETNKAFKLRGPLRMRSWKYPQVLRRQKQKTFCDSVYSKVAVAHARRRCVRFACAGQLQLSRVQYRSWHANLCFRWFICRSRCFRRCVCARRCPPYRALTSPIGKFLLSGSDHLLVGVAASSRRRRSQRRCVLRTYPHRRGI